MARQLTPHKYIFKIHSERLRRAKWDLSLTLPEARRNEEIVALNDSQMLRWIDELNGIEDTFGAVDRLKSEIRAIKRLPSGARNRREIQRLYAKIDEMQFKPDYMCLVIDRISDYRRACCGFSINGVKYTRLLGTNGGVKTSTIVFVSERLAPELRRRIENGRHPTQQIPAKFEAYRALTCSGSAPVSMPRGVLVVPDCETKFREDIIMLNDEDSDEPVMEYQKDVEIVLDESDGYGLMLPCLAERWSKEIGLHYTAGAMCSRCSWEKGMVFAFDFLDFADKVAGGKYIVKDAWGHDVDIRNVELILTTSMLKLWQSYDSIEHYLSCCEENHYTFAVTKAAPNKLEDRRATNYQFIQSYVDLTDDQIEELVWPTIEDIKGVISGDYRKALVYLRGSNLSDETVETNEMAVANALMIEPAMYNDPFVRKQIYTSISKRIDDAKIGVLDLHANYSMVCGDPYALCQSIFGLEVTGLLKAGQIYNKYWTDCGAEYLACFRAPMSTHENVRRVQCVVDEQMSYWYRYITTCTLLNAWDSLTAAMNGCDKDGDLVYLTDNRILVDNIRTLPTIFCVQRKATKTDVTEEKLIEANIASFGDDIGRTTNYVTSMYDVQASYEPGSAEYETLTYRIRSGQLYQQNAIDKAKGIVCKPMPRSWYDYFGNALPENPTQEDVDRREFNLRILADKKPYFMCYIYPKIMREYRTYMKDVQSKCRMIFGITLDELLTMAKEDLDDEQKKFVKFFESRCPVSIGNCVMNRICRRIEAEFGRKAKFGGITEPFDYSILKSGSSYTNSQYYKVRKMYIDHNTRMREHSKASRLRKEDKTRVGLDRLNFVREFSEEAIMACTNTAQLCDIVVDLCYKREGSKQFAWDICSVEILSNLLRRSGGYLSYPILDPDGDFWYGGNSYSMIRKESDVWVNLL